MSRAALRDWKKGDPLSAGHLQEAVEGVRDVGRRLLQIDDIAASPDDDEVLDETWVFVSSETRTERIEDASDASIYIDVTRTSSVTVQRPDSTIVLIQLEAP